MEATTQGELAGRALREFLEAAIHQLIHVRGLYPDAMFERRRIYGIPVKRSRHPDVNAYIETSVHSLQELIDRGSIQKLAVIILDEEDKAVERHVFSFSLKNKEITTTRDVDDVEQAFKGFLLKINALGSMECTVQDGWTFEVVLYSSDREYPGIEQWVEEDVQEGRIEIKRPVVTPIKTMHHGTMFLQAFSEHKPAPPE